MSECGEGCTCHQETNEVIDVNAVGEDSAVIKIGSIFTIAGKRFKVKKIRDKDLILRIIP